MANSVDIQNFPGAAEIEAVLHYNGTEEHDITSLVQGINISADVNITSSFAEVAVYDMSNWMERIQMGAGDAIVIKIKYGNDSYERRYRLIHICTKCQNEHLQTKISGSHDAGNPPNGAEDFFQFVLPVSVLRERRRRRLTLLLKNKLTVP